MIILGLYPVDPTPHDANVCLLRAGREERAAAILAGELGIPRAGARQLTETIRSLNIGDENLLGVIVRLVEEFRNNTVPEERSHGTQEGNAPRPS